MSPAVRKERAGEIPMERPARFGFVVNLKTARAMGANILPSLLALVAERTARWRN